MSLSLLTASAAGSGPAPGGDIPDGPTLECVEPGFGPRGRNAVVIIHGNGFSGTLAPDLPTASFGPGVAATVRAASPVTVAVRLRVGANAALGPHEVVVTNSNLGVSEPLAGGFVVTTLPAKGVLSVTAPRFARTTVGSVSEAQVVVANQGRGKLVVQPSRLLPVTGPFRLVDGYQPVVLAPKGKSGSRLRLTLQFLPQEAGTARGKLTLLSDDPRRQSVEVRLTGTAVPAAQ